MDRNEPIEWEELKLTWPYMDKICENCAWALPTAELNSENEHCRYFNKTVEPQDEACHYFVHWVMRQLL